MVRVKNIFIALMLISIPVAGQTSNTLYFMDRIPQFTQLNPASQPKCNVYVGMPGFSTFQFNIGNNSLNMGDIYQKDPSSDSLLFFMANRNTQAAFLNSLKTENSFFTNMQVDPLVFGFRVNSWYFNFSTSVKTDFSASYPKGFVDAMLRGFGENSTYNFKEFGFNTNLYAEIGLGASKIINDDFTVGAKLKYLVGFMNMSTNNKNFQFRTYANADSMFVNSISSDMTINMYAPFLAQTPDTGKISYDQIIESNNDYKFDPFQSTGFATDLGIVYNGFDDIKLSASIIDLGYITWNKNVSNYKMNGNFEFKGVDINTDSISDAFTSMSNAIQDSFKFTKTSNAYTTFLPTKIYLGAEYQLETYFSVGLLSLSQYYRSQFYQQIMAAANFRPFNMIMLSATYSVFDNGFSNMGLGFTLRLAPLQFYVISDNIPLRVSKDFMPYKLEYFNFRFGFNWVFGCTDKKKTKDKPMSWE